MALTPQEAVDIARKFELSMMDAAALVTLADNADEAEVIAARFAGVDRDDRTEPAALEAFTELLEGRLGAMEPHAAHQPMPTLGDLASTIKLEDQ